MNFRRFGRKRQDLKELGVTSARRRMPKCPNEDSPDNRRGCLLIVLLPGLVPQHLHPDAFAEWGTQREGQHAGGFRDGTAARRTAREEHSGAMGIAEDLELEGHILGPARNRRAGEDEIRGKVLAGLALQDHVLSAGRNGVAPKLSRWPGAESCKAWDRWRIVGRQVERDLLDRLAELVDIERPGQLVALPLVGEQLTSTAVVECRSR